MSAILSLQNIRSKLYSAAALALGIACTLSFIFVTTAQVEDSKKFALLKGHSHDRAPANFNKTRAPLGTSISRVDDGSNPELIRLRGTVTAKRNFENVKIIWDLPEGVQAVSGSIETAVNLTRGESQSFELLIASSPEHNRQVYFHVQAAHAKSGRNFGSTSQYNTTQQEAIAEQLKENFLKAREKVRTGELRKIIF